MSNVTAGLVIMELARGDLSIVHVHGRALGAGDDVDRAAGLGGAEAALPAAMARLEKIGAFGLTEPHHGTDVVVLETTARRDGDSYVLNGHKRWIGNATFADYVDHLGARRRRARRRVRRREGHAGLRPAVHRRQDRAALRAERADLPRPTSACRSRTAWPTRHTFRDTEKVLMASRFCVAWEALGAAIAGYETALAYAQQRHQFGVSAHQLPARPGQAGAACWPTSPAACS